MEVYKEVFFPSTGINTILFISEFYEETIYAIKKKKVKSTKLFLVLQFRWIFLFVKYRLKVLSHWNIFKSI